MIRYFVLVLGFIILGGCGNFQFQKTIQFKDGHTASVSYEIQTTDAKEKILFVEFRNERPVRKESVVEAEVLEIWSEVRSEAEKQNIEEGLIKYWFLTGNTDEKSKRVYQGLLFTADRRENGSWSIKRVD
jgi:hypothetical protein